MDSHIDLVNTKLLNARDIARILNISRSLSYRLIALGKLPAIHINKTVRVRSEDLSAFIEANKRDFSINN